MAAGADEADVVDKPGEADDLTSGGCRQADKAGDAKFAEADEADKPGDADKAKANKANEAANEADEVIAVDKAILDDAANKAIIANEANKASLAEAKELLANSIAIVLYSLTKYSAILTEVKAYFGIFVFNNQLVGMFGAARAPSNVNTCRGLILKMGNCCHPP